MSHAKEPEPERCRFFDPRQIEIVTGCLGKKEARFNPRTLSNNGFSADNMDRLSNGIAKDGLNHSLLVRLDAKTKRPKLVAGERRLRVILNLIEKDEAALKLIQAGEKDVKRVMVKNPKTGKMEPALKVYGEQGVECKITEEQDEREFLRQAIQENTLHEQLTDYELLLQCEKMEKAGFSRADQAETMDVSEAWISQSHSLLNGPDCILKAMEQEKLTRTAALTFLPVPADKVDAVLKRAIDITYHDAEVKETEAKAELGVALEELNRGESQLRLSQFTGNQESARKARRAVARAGRNKEKAEKKLESAKGKKKKKISVETITQAAKEVDGAGDNLHKPQSMKNIRLISTDLADLLKSTEDDEITNPANDQAYSRRDIAIVQGVIDFVLAKNELKHPLDAILAADGTEI